MTQLNNIDWQNTTNCRPTFRHYRRTIYMSPRKFWNPVFQHRCVTKKLAVFPTTDVTGIDEWPQHCCNQKDRIR